MFDADLGWKEWLIVWGPPIVCFTVAVSCIVVAFWLC